MEKIKIVDFDSKREYNKYYMREYRARKEGFKEKENKKRLDYYYKKKEQKNNEERAEVL